MKKILRKQNGYTLIELLIYIGMFSLIIVTIVGLIVEAALQRVQNQNIALINYQGDAIMSAITYDINNATSINSPAAGYSSNNLSLGVSTQSQNPTVFNSVTTGSNTQLQISQGSPSVSNFLSGSHINISNLSFNNLSLPNTPGSVLITYTLTYNSNSKNDAYSYSKTFSGAASIR